MAAVLYNLPPDWPAADAERAFSLWCAGASYAEIGKKLGRTAGSVNGYVNRHRDRFGFRRAKAARRHAALDRAALERQVAA